MGKGLGYENKCHRLMPMRPVNKNTFTLGNNLHQIQICRICNKLFESVIYTLKDENGTFRVERTIRPIEAKELKAV